MLSDLLGALWRRVPNKLKRLTMRASNARFSVSAGAIITNGEGKVLLLKHRFRPSPGWGVPGGFLKQGEQPEAGLRRELLEEVDLELKDVKLFFVRTFKRPSQVEIIFTARTTDDTDRLSYEIQKAAWFSPDELPSELPADQARLIKRAFADGVAAKD